MNFKELVPTLEITLYSGNVGYVNGHAGLGKSSLAYEIANRSGGQIVPVILFGSVLKEGEINK